MPMAGAITFSPSPENYISSVGLSDFQNGNYTSSPVYQGVHMTATEQDACLRLSADAPMDNPTEPYGGAALQETSNTCLTVIEQPKSKWRYRYESEKGSHGGLPGCSSTSTRRTYPTVKLLNFSGSHPVYIKASLWTNEINPKMHVHKLCGQRCEKDGTCIIKLNADMTAVFQDVTILFVAKKEVAEILFQRKLGKYDLTCIPDSEKKRLKDEAEKEARNMNLNSVKLCFEAFYCAPETKKCIILSKVFSSPVANQKSPDAGDLKICRMSRVAGSVIGGDEVYLLVSKVNKKDISVRFYECNSGWEAFGIFTEADVHYQYAIVLKTPPYCRTDIKSPVTVLVELQRKNGEASEAKEFTYIPYDPDDEAIGKKRKKHNLYEEFDRSGRGQYEAFGVPDYSQCGSMQPSALDNNESVNGSSLGSSSSCIGHSDSAESFLMESFDEQVFDSLYSENSSEDSSLDNSAVAAAALIKPHEDPLLSEANVQKPKWSLPDAPSSSMQVDNAYYPMNQGLYNAFSRLSISEDRSTKKTNVNSISHFVNPPHPSKKAMKITAGTDGHSNDIKENALLKKEAPQNRVSGFLAKRIWDCLSVAAVSGNPFTILNKLHHIINFSNEDGDTLLHLAVIHQRNNTNLVENLLKVSDGDVSCPLINLANKEQQTPLHLAVIMQKHSLVRLLLQHGADPTVQDRNGCTSIYLAVNNSSDCLREILNHCNTKSSQQWLHLEHFNHCGLAPLHYAVSGGFVECIGLLCEGGADVNVQSKKDGRTPLHFATDKDISVIRLLLAQKDINVNAQDYGGNTALHLACAIKRPEIVSQLMLLDANPLIENFEHTGLDTLPHAGKTPYDFANGNEEIIKILAGVGDQAFGASSNFDRSVRWQQPVDSITLKPELSACGPKEPSQINNCTRKNSGPELDKEHMATQNDSGFISGSISMLNEEILRQLCQLLDPPNNSWKDLIMFTGLDEAVQENISKLAPSSPTKAIIEVFLREGGDIKTLIGALEAANLTEAQSVLKSYQDSTN